MALPAPLVKPLADALGDAFAMPELDGVVLRATGLQLFKEWVPEGDTHRITAYKLLVRLGEEGRETLFLAHVLVARPSPQFDALRLLVAQACPDAASLKLDLGNQVPAVVQRLEAAHARFADDGVRAALAKSRDALTVVVRDIDTLEVFKNLHESLHQLQIKAFSELRLAAKQVAANDAQRGYLLEQWEQIENSSAAARLWIDRLPGEETTKRVERLWVDALEAAAPRLQAGVEQRDVRATLAALNEVRRVIRHEPVRLSKLIYLTASDLPLKGLTEDLRKASEANGGARAELGGLYSALRDLHATLLGRVVEHKMWQDADNQIWELEDTLEGPPDDDFILAWPDAKGAVRALAQLEPNAAWAKKSEVHAARIDDELAREPVGPGFKEAFDNFRREARARFFRVDSLLKAECGALVRIGAPLHGILRDL